MGLSEDADQQRRRETSALKQFVGLSLAGSLLLHAISLSLRIAQPWSANKPRPTEVTIVPRKAPPVQQAPPEMPPERLPEKLPETPPEKLPELLEQANPEAPLAARPEVLPSEVSPADSASAAPEGDPDALADESPLVGSGLAPGSGGFSEGIGLNRSNSPIRGSGGGARQGVPGGVPDGVPGGSVSPPPAAAAPSAPQPDPPPESDPSRRAVCRRCPSPDYPRAALQARAEGRVQVAVDVDASGRILNVRLANSSGDRDIDAAVLETVRQRWRFEAISGGANNLPVEVYMTVAGSEFNRRAQDWGEQTALEVPATGFAAPPPEPARQQRKDDINHRHDIDFGDFVGFVIKNVHRAG